MNMLVRRALPQQLAVLVACIAVGALTAVSPEIGFLLACLLLALPLTLAPASVWTIGAVVVALTFPGLETLGVLPSTAIFLDIPLAWGAFAIALVKRSESSPVATNYLRLLVVFLAAVFLSYLLNPSELLRPILYIALIGQPFALLGALLLDPPSLRQRRVLAGAVIGLLALQIPVGAMQALVFGLGDPIEGTLYGAGSGTRAMSAVAVVGSVWLFAMWQQRKGTRRSPLPLLLSIPLFMFPFVADVRQILFATPVGLLAMKWRRGSKIILIVGAVAMLFVIFSGPRGAVSRLFLERAQSGEGGKAVALSVVTRELASDPPSFFFGAGPAESVSRSAFMTTDVFLEEQSPLQAFGLHPSTLALEADARARGLFRGGGGGSFNSGLSSALGVVGDVGIVGGAAYAALAGFVFISLRRRRSPEAVAAVVGWGIFLVFGFTFDGWEQPPFTLFLATLSGLALTHSAREQQGSSRMPRANPELAPPDRESARLG